MSLQEKRNFLWCLTVIAGFLSPCCNAEMERMDRMNFTISKTWDDRPIEHPLVKIMLYRDNDSIVAEIQAFFFNDTPPSGEPGKPFDKLYDYEVVELFFLGADDRYLEAEFSPHGQHLLLLLSGERNAIKMCLPVEYMAEIDGNMWKGKASIPLSYFPPKVNRFNAYAIHGTGFNRMYEALFPVPTNLFPAPNFHRLEYFGNIDFGDLLKPNENLSEVWEEALKSEGQSLNCEADV